MANSFTRFVFAALLSASAGAMGFSGAVVVSGPAYAQEAFVPFVVLINGVPVTVTSVAQASQLAAANPSIVAEIARQAVTANVSLASAIAAEIARAVPSAAAAVAAEVTRVVPTAAAAIAAEVTRVVPASSAAVAQAVTSVPNVDVAAVEVAVNTAAGSANTATAGLPTGGVPVY